MYGSASLPVQKPPVFQQGGLIRLPHSLANVSPSSSSCKPRVAGGEEHRRSAVLCLLIPRKCTSHRRPVDSDAEAGAAMAWQALCHDAAHTQQ